MKTKLFAILLFSLITGAFQSATAANIASPTDVKVVVSAKKIWFIADEMPVKCLCVKVTNSEGKIVLEKCLNSKMADWSLNVASLPGGTYTLYIGKDRTQQFKR